MILTETLVSAPLRLDLAWSDGTLRNMSLSWSAPGDAPRLVTEMGRELAKALDRYVAGERVDWPELPIELEGMPRFKRRVLEELVRVPAGQVVSYGGLAAICGSPGAARAVGQVMASNRWPLIYPCHRVLASGGGLGGFGPGLEMKKWLLELEGAL
ncbi:methylated-DNA--[protein]-cysteine S-methyltransferase [Fundidesulfovibrio agrisoli]|uniref:methylated-DNA--[protein]-cysteine S-methyltransferase n=1 Tax=Fundidesulfovibrio agrisoli TaxID=2922717 RepID=UPI001FABACBC|nr:methylated-DNA--[protein]-cysteine S-methyltransferase [Fundidesulfovibrio agrisoli]